jgi:hypothetical protein
MAAKKMIVKVEIELEVLKKLLQAAEALSELASASIMGCDDPQVRSLVKGSRGRGGGAKAKKKAKR